jgi:GntR family transcriptional repressor for pyruvate dehydrogenase complex
MSSPIAPLRPIAPSRLVDDVVDHLRAYVNENALEDGVRLPPERSLADRLGTSRATVAQGLRVLAVMGMVEIRHGSGVYVRRDPTSLLGTTFDLMVDMEPESVGQLADFRYWIEKSLTTEDSLPQFDVERLNEEFTALMGSRSRLQTWIEADADFHVTLVGATRNRYLRATYEMAHRKILSVSYAGWIEKGTVPSWLRGDKWKVQVDLHRRILEAVEAEDRSALLGALEAHQDELMSHLARAVDLTP